MGLKNIVRKEHKKAVDAALKNGHPAEETQAEKSALHLQGMVEHADAPASRIVLPALEIRAVELPIIGDTPLIVHRFSQKAQKMMLDKQRGRANAGKEKKDPVGDFLDSLYEMEGGKLKGVSSRDAYELGDEVTIDGGCYGFPAIGFKASMVTACTSTGKAITKVQARQAFHLEGFGNEQLVPIKGKLSMRNDMVRLQGTTADIRFRGEFFPWAAVLTVRYNARVLSSEQLANLLSMAGFGVGVGEWRPEKDGQYGMWHVATPQELADFNELMKEDKRSGK